MDDIGNEGRGVGYSTHAVLYLEAPPRGPTPYVIFNRKGAPFKNVV